MTIFLTILSIVIITVVALQSKGTGLSIVPGSGDFGKFERRGAEKSLHMITIGLIVIFVATTLVHYFIA